VHVPEPRLRPAVVDAGVSAAVGAVALVGLVLPPLLGVASWGRVGSGVVALAIVQAGALWWRRQNPIAVLLVTLGIVLLAQVVGDENAAWFLGPHVAIYTAGVERRHDLAALGIVAGAAACGLLLWWLGPPGQSIVLLSPTGWSLVAAWGVGRYVHVRRAYIATLVSYAHQLEAERDEQARRAVRDERRRIARELHDQVAHHLGVVALQTGAARRWLGRDAARADEAMTNIEASVRSALTTMPVILEALRSDTANELAPARGVADIEDLVTRVTAAGLPTELSVVGRRRALPPAVEATAYRVVQEALTNTMKHAGRARATVGLSFAGDHLGVEVCDDGDGLASTTTGGGFGLAGMRERIDLLGGVLVSGPREGGGFTVRATIPVTRTPQ
jgi:signal transduction histidine kinase